MNERTTLFPLKTNTYIKEINMPAYTLVAHLYSKPENVDKVKAKLQEASQVYSKDKETLGW